jgi:hypothetical protein
MNRERDYDDLLLAVAYKDAEIERLRGCELQLNTLRPKLADCESALAAAQKDCTANVVDTCHRWEESHRNTAQLIRREYDESPEADMEDAAVAAIEAVRREIQEKS